MPNTLKPISVFVFAFSIVGSPYLRFTLKRDSLYQPETIGFYNHPLLAVLQSGLSVDFRDDQNPQANYGRLVIRSVE